MVVIKDIRKGNLMKCEFCGTKLREQSVFCLGCGKPVNAKNCYIKELTESGKVLEKETDIQSLERIIGFVETIYEKTDEDPEQIRAARNFYDYYLPTITEVVSKYKKTKGKASARDRQEIEAKLTAVLDETERAFELLLNKLYESDILDLKVAIEVLQAKIKMDGLTDPEFDLIPE